MGTFVRKALKRRGRNGIALRSDIIIGLGNAARPATVDTVSETVIAKFQIKIRTLSFVA